MSFASSGGKKEEKVWIPKGKSSPFHDGPRNDQLFAMVMALTVEVAILRDRLDTHERVSEKKGGFSSKDIEEYNTDNEALSKIPGWQSSKYMHMPTPERHTPLTDLTMRLMMPLSIPS